MYDQPTVGQDETPEPSFTMIMESQEDKRLMKVAWIAALLFHFILFIIVFPSMGESVFAPAEQEVVVIKKYVPPTPPKEQPEKKVVKKSAARVPIPDPTPDEPEPIVSEEVEFIEDDTVPVETNFVVGMPTGGPPSLAPEGPIRVGGDVQRPEKIYHVDPNYPELARRARKEGFVILEAVIDKQGNVSNLTITRGSGLGLDEAAEEAVKQWKYTPSYYNGRPVEVILTVTVVFQLTGE